MNDVMSTLHLEPEWVRLNLEAASDIEAITKLADVLYQAGVVKESYVNAVISREAVYPTGLQCEGIGVAIPHTDSEHVNVQGLGIAVLKNPVRFKQMGMLEVDVEVKLIILLAIKEPKQQIAFLQALMMLFADSLKLKRLTECSTEEEVVKTFIGFFESKEEV